MTSADAHNRIRIGCSGYDYPQWSDDFYPNDLSQEDRFGYYASIFNTLEVNNTFYNLPEPETVDDWRERAPSAFRYILKLSRYGTHMKKLKDPDEWIDNFLSPAERLKSFLGPILVQLPPHWDVDVDRLRGFLNAAPRRHRWAIECRDPSWLCDDVFELLERNGAALVLHDLIEDHPKITTADWVYLRYHGPDPSEPYTGAYAHQTLSADATRIAEWADSGKDVFVFFNNDKDADAPRDAQRLMRYTQNALKQRGALPV